MKNHKAITKILKQSLCLALIAVIVSTSASIEVLADEAMPAWLKTGNEPLTFTVIDNTTPIGDILPVIPMEKVDDVPDDEPLQNDPESSATDEEHEDGTDDEENEDVDNKIAENADENTDPDTAVTDTFHTQAAIMPFSLDAVITRADWIKTLVTLFEMSVEDDNMPDDYFFDVEEDHPSYRDIMVATEFGVIDTEVGESFYPEAAATREFVAQTMVYCLGFAIDEEETYAQISDLDQTAYPDAVQLSVWRGWFALDSGAFSPQAEVTEAEAEYIVSDATEVWTSIEIDENHENTFEFAVDAVEIPDGTELSVDEDGTVLILDCPVSITTGQSFVVFLNGIPAAYNALSVSMHENITVITTSEAQADDIIIDMDAQGVVEGDLGLAEAAADTRISYYDDGTMERLFTDGTEYENLLDLAASGTIRPKAIKVAAELSHPGGRKIKVEALLSNLAVKYKVSAKNREVSVVVSGDTQLTGSASFDFWAGGGDPSEIELVYIPIKGVGKITVSVEYSVTGKVALKYSGEFEGGFQYSPKTGFRVVRSFKKKSFTISTELEIKTGLKAALGINMGVVKGSVFIRSGVIMRLTAITYPSDLPRACLQHSSFLYAEVGAAVSFDIVVWKASYTVSHDIYHEKNSPVRVLYHYEDGVPVPCCTRDREAFHGSGYYTSGRSRYGSVFGGQSISGNWRSRSGVVAPVFTYTVTNNEATITGFTGNVSVLTIPSSLGGYPVVAIANATFQNKTALEVVVIPDSVRTIERDAFAGCTRLSSVTLSKNLESLGFRAFYNCTALEEIEIPKSLSVVPNVSLGSQSGPFTDCVNLKTVTFESGTTRIVGGLFGNCTGLERIDIPDTVTTIEANAFGNATSLVEVNMPDSVTTIGDSAFRNCSVLPGINISDFVTSIGAWAFSDCTMLTSIIIPDSVRTIEREAFSGCTRLSSVTLSKNLESLGFRAFYNCISLEEIEIPKSLSVVPNVSLGSQTGPFTDCVNLKTVTFESGTTRIVGGLFGNCTGLSNSE